MKLPWVSKSVLIFFIAFDLFVLGLHLALVDHTHLGAFVDIHKEGNFPTWYSSLKFTLVSVLAFSCFYLERQPETDVKPWGWVIVGFVMLAMSLDETGQFHEMSIHWFFSTDNGKNLALYFNAQKGAMSLLWVVVFSPFLITILGGLIYFYNNRLEGKAVLLFGALGAIALLAGAAGMEYYEAKLLISENVFNDDFLGTYKIFSAVEEMLENFASSLLAWVHYAYVVRLVNISK
jgi:hypothetical protein